MFRHEPELTQWLAARFPERLPEVLGADTDRGWLLMKDAGSQTLDQVTDAATYVETARKLAEIQVALLTHTNELGNLGVPHRGLDLLAAGIDPLLADIALMQPTADLRLSDAEITRLQGLGPQLHRACAELAALNIPLSLEHGDFWAGQVVLRQEAGGKPQPIFIDWSDATIAHPFFSLCYSLNNPADVSPLLPDTAAACERMRTAYLEAWTAYASLNDLRKALHFAQQIALLHSVLLYRDIILPQMTVKWEMHGMVPFLLRQLLAVFVTDDDIR